MSYWLAKSDPETYGWTELVRDGKTTWDGVRNFTARNHLRAMKPGDLVLFYHSGEQKAVVGAMKIVAPPGIDKTADDDSWTSVEVSPAWALMQPVNLADIKAEPALKDIALVRLGRLSVMPLEKPEFDRIVEMGGGSAKLR